MNLSVKEVAGMLNVSNKTIYRMIKAGTIPCFRVGGQWRFSKKEVASWLEDVRGFNQQSIISQQARDEESIPLSEFISRGGIYDGIAGQTKEAAIAACLRAIGENITSIMDMDALFSSIMEREALCTTSTGQGIAFPHPATFGKFTSESYIALCRLSHPVAYSSLDNEPVDTLFFIFPKNERRYLRIQAKLMRILRDDDVLSAIKGGGTPGAVIEKIARKESEIFGEAAVGF